MLQIVQEKLFDFSRKWKGEEGRGEERRFIKYIGEHLLVPVLLCHSPVLGNYQGNLQLCPGRPLVSAHGRAVSAALQLHVTASDALVEGFFIKKKKKDFII